MKFLKTAAAIALLTSLLLPADSNGQDWLRFRGNDGSGVSTESVPTATEFSADKNMAWKIELPGSGASAPIIVGDKVIVSCYSGYGESRDNIGKMDDLKRHVLCYNKKTGEKIWQKDYESVLPEDNFSGMGVPEHGYASGTPTSDGKHVYVFFGKTGVVCLDLDGKPVWQQSVGKSSGRMRWGSGASPVVHGDVVIVNASDESSALVGLDKNTGKEVWKNEGISNVWGTPVVSGGDNPVVIFSIPSEIWGLNPKNGKLKWLSTNGVSDSSVSTSPIVKDDMVIAMGGRSGTAVAIKLGGKGDVTKSKTVWEGKATGRIVSPVAIGEYIFGFDRGIANCLKADTGESVFRERLPAPKGGAAAGGGRRGPSSDYCSPVSADGKIYQFTKTGTCYVIAAKPEFEVLAVNSLADSSEFNSTPAISEGKIYVRSNKHLYCIGTK